MNIERTKIIGFCNGVRRAIKMAEDNRGAYIAGGEIVHNPMETARLERDFDIRPSDIKDIPENTTAVIRAHGIGADEIKLLGSKGIKTIDATCPNVCRVQNLARELISDGYAVFLFGNPGHPEVMGICGHAAAPITIFSSADELDQMQIPARTALISQTTKPIHEFRRAEKIMAERASDFKCVCTICPVTQNNQDAASELAQRCDIMIIIGGKKSSNTHALVSVAEMYCDEVYHVESAADLDHKWFIDKQQCGIAAGLSTPDYAIDAVEAAIKLAASN